MSPWDTAFLTVRPAGREARPRGAALHRTTASALQGQGVMGSSWAKEVALLKLLCKVTCDQYIKKEREKRK